MGMVEELPRRCSRDGDGVPTPDGEFPVAIFTRAARSCLDEPSPVLLAMGVGVVVLAQRRL